MKTHIYDGPLDHLKGQTALVREATHDKVVAQFDYMGLSRSGAKVNWNSNEPLPPDALAFGWHVFDPTGFVGVKT